MPDLFSERDRTFFNSLLPYRIHCEYDCSGKGNADVLLGLDEMLRKERVSSHRGFLDELHRECMDCSACGAEDKTVYREISLRLLEIHSVPSTTGAFYHNNP